jgi:hypothetical protein
MNRRRSVDGESAFLQFGTPQSLNNRQQIFRNAPE